VLQMNIDNLKTIVANFKKLEYPSRVTRGQLVLYEQVLSNLSFLNKEPTVVVLGADPEILDLCLENGCKVISIIRNPIIAQITNFMMKYQGHRNHKSVIVKDNWLKLPLPKNSCDLVLTEFALSLHPYKDYEILLKEIQRVLKPDGLCFTRKFDLPTGYKKPEIKQVLALWRKGEITHNDFIVLCCKRMSDENYNADCGKLWDIFENMYANGKFTDEEFKLIKPYTTDMVVSCPYRKDLIKTFSKFFEDISIQFATDPKMKTVKEHPLYLMRVKK